MAVRTRVLALATITSGGAVKDVYTVPAGRTAIVKEVSVENATGATAVVQLWVRRSAVQIPFAAQSALAGALATWGPREWAFNPGDVLQAFVPGAVVNCRVYVAGALLLGEPE